jgi:hypothetical protein
MQIKPNKSWGLVGVGVLLGASVAYAAADPRYNTAVEGIDRATTMLSAIGTGTEKPGAAFQRKRALKALERAKVRIACAKEIENSATKKRGCPAAMKDRFEDNDDDRDDDHGHGRDHDHDHKDKKEKEKAEKEKAAKEKAEKEKAEKEKAAKEKQKK